MRRFEVSVCMVVVLMALFAGNAAAQYGNIRVGNATGVYGETVDVTISLQQSGLLGSVSMGLEFDTSVFQVVGVQSTGPFAQNCDVSPEFVEEDFGATITALEDCDPFSIGLISPWPAVLIVSFEIIGADTGAYTISVPNSFGVTDPVPLFEPDGEPFLFVGAQNGTFVVIPVKLSISSGSAAQGSKGTIIDLNLDVGTPDGVAALQFDLLFDTDILSVTAIEKIDRASNVPVWNFSAISGGIRLLASLAGNPGEEPIGQGSGAIGRISVNVAQSALDQDYALTFADVTVGDPLGNELETKIVDGTFTVIRPAAILTVGEGAGYAGTSATIPVSLYLTSNISSIQFDVDYDDDALELTGATGFERGSTCTFTVDGNTVSGDCALNAGTGSILRLAFDVDAEADGGSYALTVSNVQILSDDEPLAVGAENGRFDVVDSSTAVVSVVNAAAMVGAAGNVVSISLLNDMQVSGFQMDLLFDTQYITVTTVAKTSRSTSMTLSQSADANGLRVILYSGTAKLINAGSGAILNVTFEVADDAPEGSYDLTVSGVVVGDVGGAEVETEAISGTIWITCGDMGDINDDFAFNVTDVVALINIIVQKTDVDVCTAWKADFNGDGSINVLDAVAMVTAILGGTAKAAVPATQAAVVSAGEIVVSGRSLDLPITIESRSDIYGAQVTVTYDAQTLAPGTPLWAGGSVASHAAPGELTMVICSTDGRPLALDRLTVPFEVTGEVESLAFGEVILAGANGQPIAADVEAIALKSDPVPREFALGQNYPNPFNPRTQICFSLPRTSRVELSVYNVLGQKVATLVQTEMAAGQHTVTWAAEAMPTGVYFYTITAGEYAATKRMVLLK